MRFRTVLAIAILLIVSAFLIVNWNVFAAPARFNLIVSDVDVPVGAVMLGVFALLMLTLIVYVGLWQSTLMLEYRRQTKELQTQRTLADNAEASRFTEMGVLLQREMAALTTRLEAALSELRVEFRDTENSIAATLGEMDDRIQRVTGPGAH